MLSPVLYLSSPDLYFDDLFLLALSVDVVGRWRLCCVVVAFVASYRIQFTFAAKCNVD